MRAVLFSIFGLLILAGLALPALAFDQEKCGDLFPRIGDTHPPYFSPLYTSTMIPSTSSYMSSTGKCSMYGGSTATRRDFVSNSYEIISREAAQGGGEYVTALGLLSGCAPADKVSFSRALQDAYAQIFDNPDETNPDSVTRKIDAMLASDATLKNHCRMIN